MQLDRKRGGRRPNLISYGWEMYWSWLWMETNFVAIAWLGPMHPTDLWVKIGLLDRCSQPQELKETWLEFDISFPKLYSFRVWIFSRYSVVQWILASHEFSEKYSETLWFAISSQKQRKLEQTWKSIESNIAFPQQINL